MKNVKIVLLAVLALSLVASLGFAAGDAEKGKVLFNDPKLGGGISGKSCNTCHPGGKGLEGVGEKTGWQTPGGKSKTLEGAVNTCITQALRGKAVDLKSQDMADIVAYIKTIKSNPTKNKKVEGY